MKTYIVDTESESFKFDSLKKARDFIRSLINVQQVKGLQFKVALYSEVVRRKKIEEFEIKDKNVGTLDQLF